MYYQTYKQSWSVILTIKQIPRQSEINVFDLRQLHKKYWRQIDIMNTGQVTPIDGYRYPEVQKTWTFEDEQVTCTLSNAFYKHYSECSDFWCVTHGPMLEQACAWYQEFKQQYPQYTTQLQYHEFSQSVIPHSDMPDLPKNSKLSQCKLNYVALSNSTDYIMSGDQKMVHIPGQAYLFDSVAEHSAVASDKNILLTVIFNHPFEEVVNQIEYI